MGVGFEGPCRRFRGSSFGSLCLRFGIEGAGGFSVAIRTSFTEILLLWPCFIVVFSKL
jgi:hypothetical protein